MLVGALASAMTCCLVGVVCKPSVSMTWPRLQEVTLVLPEAETLVLQLLQHVGQMVEMLLCALSCDDDVIQVTSHSCQTV